MKDILSCGLERRETVRSDRTPGACWSLPGFLPVFIFVSQLPELRNHLNRSPRGCGKRLANGQLEALNWRCLLCLPSDWKLSQSGYVTVRKMNSIPIQGFPKRGLVYSVSMKWGILWFKSDNISRKDHCSLSSFLREEGLLGHRESLLLSGYMTYSVLKRFQCKIHSLGNRQSHLRNGKKPWQSAQGLATSCCLQGSHGKANWSTSGAPTCVFTEGSDFPQGSEWPGNGAIFWEW